jgi:hypothetical protein
MGRKGVSGTAIGQRGGGPCLLVYVSDKQSATGVPRTIDGFSVVIETTGSFRRL